MIRLESSQRRINILELRCADGAGGGPEKTILHGAALADPSRFHVTVCYIRRVSDREFSIDERARDLRIDFAEIRERHLVDPDTCTSLSRLCDDLQIDIVHSHDYKSNLLALWLARRKGITPVSTAHGWTGDSPRERLVYYPADRWLLRHFLRVLAVSTEIRETLVRAGVSGRRVDVVLNGIDANRFQRRRDGIATARHALGLADDETMLLAVGRLAVQKRFDLLLEALAELLPARRRIRLVIAGDGELNQQLQATANRCGVRHRCLFLGHRDDVIQLHRAADLFVQSSEYEGTPNALLEAMAMETPLVATNVGGTRELIEDREHGLLVEPGNAAELAAAIERAIDNPIATRQRAIAGRCRVERDLSFEVRVRRVEQIYEELIESRGRNSPVTRAIRTTTVQRPIRVCCMIDSLRVGGTESQVVTMIRNIDRAKVIPHLCLLDGEDELSRSLEPEGVPIVRLGIKQLLHVDTYRAAQQLRRFLLENGIDILQLHFPDSTYLGVLAGCLSGVARIVKTRRGLVYWKTMKHRLLGRPLDIFFNRFLVDRLVVNSEACRNIAVRDEHAVQTQTIVMSNGVDLSRFNSLGNSPPFQSSTIRVGVVAMLRPEKKLDTFIDSATLVLSKYDNVVFSIAGEGPMRSSLEEQISRLALNDHVSLVGRTDDVASFLQGIDIAVLCSGSESLSNSVIEYMAAGRPIVVTDVGGNRELIEPNVDGLVVQPNDPKSLAKAIEQLIVDRSLALRLATAARQKAKHKFSLEMMTKRYEDFYQELLGRSNEVSTSVA